MKKIAVFLSGYVTDDKYARPAIRFAELMAREGYGLVWGGTNLGLMRVVCSTVQAAGGHLYGVTMELLQDSRKLDADEMIIASTLQERKMLLLEKADAVVVMVGGIGTLDEATEVIELKKHGAHRKPIVFLNTEDFFEGLQLQLRRMEREGFIPKPLDGLIYFAKTPEEAIEFIKEALK